MIVDFVDLTVRRARKEPRREVKVISLLDHENDSRESRKLKHEEIQISLLGDEIVDVQALVRFDMKVAGALKREVFVEGNLDFSAITRFNMKIARALKMKAEQMWQYCDERN